MKNLFPILPILLLCTLFVSCSGLFESFNDDSSSAKTGYITLSVNTPRTVSPKADIADFTDFTLSGSHSGESKELAKTTSFDALKEKNIEMETGSWSFTLSAKLNSITWTGTTEAVEISAGNITALSFTLEQNETTTGSFSITLNLEEPNNAKVAVYSVNGGNSEPITIENNSLTISDTKEAGSYNLSVTFYGDTAQTVKLNTYYDIILLKAGLQSTLTRTISLNKLYTISYIKDGETFSTVSFSRHSDNLTLPTTDFTVYGWYTDSAFTQSFEVPETLTPATFMSIADENNDIKLYAKWYIGTKPAPDAVGDIVFNDGSATPYTGTVAESDYEKAIAVIFYVGTGTATRGTNVNILGQKMLGVGLTLSEKMAWQSGTSEAISAISCTSSSSASSSLYYTYSYNGSTKYLTGDFNGSDNYSSIEDASIDSPAFSWVNRYASINSITGTYETGWYMPSAVELHLIYNEKEKVNAAFQKVEASVFSGKYWSASTKDNYSYYVDFTDSDTGGNMTDAVRSLTSDNAVCAIREF